MLTLLAFTLCALLASVLLLASSMFFEAFSNWADRVTNDPLPVEGRVFLAAVLPGFALLVLLGGLTEDDVETLRSVWRGVLYGTE